MAVKAWAKRHWPALRLRTILFATLFLVAALPGVGAVFLRVYENTLVRQTEAELVAQGAALQAASEALWPGAPAAAMPPPGDLHPEPPQIDLSSTPLLPERAAPVRDGRPVAADARAAGAAILPLLARTRQTTLAGILLLDRDGRIVGGPAAGAGMARLAEVRAAISGRPATVLRRNGAYRATYRFEWLSRAAAIRVHHARPIVVGGRVVGVILLSRSARALFRGIYEDRGKIAIGIGAILLALIALSGLLSRGIARPIEALGAATRAVARGSGTIPPVPPTAAIEIQGLYADFAAMAVAIDHRSRYLRDFAHAVSHEFKTPLAGIRGALELLVDHDATMTAADRARFLANADADAGRLTLLVTRLLDLARADMTAAATQARTVLPPILSRLADAHRSPSFAVVVVADSDVGPVTPSATTIETVLTTLIENSRQAGATKVTLTLSATPQAAILHIADDGPGVAEADRARIFEPFFTTHRARGGTGLGLPIVRSLLATAGGGIELVALPGPAIFIVTIPRAE
ncbi:sensor histidine kinase [Sphingomonas sp. Leaf17]|uniref:sensor histidine kinase n=1 Tax=Sphingomonas sp. Leaf17 TaxID=1735683 RepID=UPI000A96F026|nr:HAMP domain-containing sensor histidine kinase [Sphingomonas sp. Leaf17]